MVQAGTALAATSPLAERPNSTYQTNGRVNSIVVVGNTIYIGGDFTRVRPAGSPLGANEVTRNHLAAIDAPTGRLLPWDPDADDVVHSMSLAPDGSALFMGGVFKRIDGEVRRRLAAVSPVTGDVLDWSPEANIRVRTVLATEDRIYVGGKFTTINGTPRIRLAALDYQGNLDPDWAPTADDDVRTLAATLDGERIFAGGDFEYIDDEPRRRVVPLDAHTGEALPWAYHPAYPIRQFAVTEDRLFVAGDGGGGHLDGYDLATGARVFGLTTDGGVQAVAYLDGVLYGGGHFDNVCVDGGTGIRPFICDDVSAQRRKLVAVDPVTGDLDPWNPGANSPLGVFWLASRGSSLLSGGDFTRTGQRTEQQGFAMFSPPGLGGAGQGGGGAPLFADAFSNGLGQWDRTVGMTIDPSQGGAAPPSALIDVAGGRGKAVEQLSTTYGRLCMSSAVAVPLRPPGSLTLLRFRTASNGPVVKVIVDRSGHLRVKSDVSRAKSMRAARFGPGWHTVELCGTVGSNGEWFLYFDGVRVLDGWLANTGAVPIGRVEIGDPKRTTYQARFDDVVVDTGGL
jgi:outer membrane protein assembly factor BamB